MKITHVKTYLVHEKQRKNFIFVKLETDAGVAGWGEAHTSLDMDTAVSAHLEQISRYVIGRDPFHIREFTQVACDDFAWRHGSLEFYSALSGIEMAMWDIVGKIHNVPCHKLWGGPVRDTIRLYSHLGGGRMEDMYCCDPADAPRFADLARKAVEEGFTAFKTMAVPETMPLEGLQPIRYAEACLKAMRDAVGDAIDIMVDCHARPSPRMRSRCVAASIVSRCCADAP